MNIEEIKNEIARLNGLSFRLNQSMERRETENQLNWLKDRLVEKEYEAGIYLKAKPHKSSYDSKYLVTGAFSGVKAFMKDVLHNHRKFDDSCYGIHDFLVSVKAIRPNVECDHESSQCFYYFSTMKSAENFVERINKTLHKLYLKNHTPE